MMPYSPPWTKPPSIPELGVIGCVVTLIMLAYVGCALYVCIRTGFANTQADVLLAVGVLIAGALLALRNWAARHL